jgi:type IV secretory pathway VirB2 component (pilin)
MVVLLNTSQEVGFAIWGLNSITGSFYVTLLIIFIILIGLAMMFRIPIEFTALILLPVGIGFAVASNNFVPVLIVVLIYVGILLAQHFFFNK